MDEAELATLERRMEDRWQEFGREELTASTARLEHLYDRYLDALDAYMRAKRKALAVGEK